MNQFLIVIIQLGAEGFKCDVTELTLHWFVCNCLYKDWSFPLTNHN